MLNAFAIAYLTLIVFVACDNNFLQQNLHDINALMAFLSLSFLCMAIIRRKELEGGKTVLPISLFLFLTYSAGSFYFSLNADLSIYPALKLLSALFLATALMYFLNNTETLNKALLLVFIFGGILAASSIIEQFFSLEFPFRQSSIPASRSFFMNPNFFGGYLVIHIPIGMFLYFRATDAFEKTLLGLGWVLILVALLFSKSQGGQLAASIQLFLVIRYFLFKKESDKAKLTGLGILISFLIYIAICKLILEPNFLVAEVEPEPISPPAFNNIELRLLYWLGAWRIFLEHWLLGSGLWTFIELYPQTGLDRIPAHAHNLYLQTAAETGLIGIALLTTCLASLCLKLNHIYKKANARVTETSIFIALSLLGFLLHNISEYNWLTANFIYYFVFLVISVEVLYRETPVKENSTFIFITKRIWPKTVAIIIVLGALTILQYYRYQRVISYDIRVSQSVNEIFANLAKAKEICIQCAKPYYLSGIIHLDNYRLSKNRQSLIKAENNFKEVIDRNPNGRAAYLKMGTTRSLQGNYSEAREYYKMAMKDPRYRREALAEFLILGNNK